MAKVRSQRWHDQSAWSTIEAESKELIERGESDVTDFPSTTLNSLAIRKRMQLHILAGETPSQRLQRFVRLQRAAVELLRSSPKGYRHFLQRNYRCRRTRKPPRATDGY